MAIYNYTVLKTSKKGALLITDGTKIVWVMARARRKDGTFGDGARKYLAESKIFGSTLEDLDKFNNQIVTAILKWQPSFETEKAWKVGFNTWFPKSLCTIIKNEDKTFTVTGPRWILLKEFTESELTAA